MSSKNLVRQDFRPSIGKLPAHIARQKPRRQHPQFKPPRIVPLAACRPLQRRINPLHFAKLLGDPESQRRFLGVEPVSD